MGTDLAFVPVNAGVFTATMDFGAGAINGQARWLAIEVQCVGEPGLTPLTPRVPMTPAPHALALPGLYTQQNATSPNIIGGHSDNTVSVGVVGATISGGGDSSTPNTAGADYATVGGGTDHNADGPYSTVGGGERNRAAGFFSTIGGGAANWAGGSYSTVPGGFNNRADGDYSFAAGSQAIVFEGHDRTFVWADNGFYSTGPNQFLIKAEGGVGINTNAPGAALAVYSNSLGTIGDSVINLVADTDNDDENDTPYLRFGADGGTTSAFIGLGGNAGTPFEGLSVTDSLSNALIFYTPGASRELQFGTNTKIDMTIATSGNVGIGTTAPGFKLEVAGPMKGQSLLLDSLLMVDGGTLFMDPLSDRVGVGDGSPDVALDVVGDINYTGVIQDVSDERLKENIAPLEDALNRVRQLNGVYFNMKDTPERRDAGFIAQNVQEVLPEAVRVVDAEAGYLGVSYPSLIPLLVEAIKEQNGAISERDCEIADLRSEIAELKSMVKALAERDGGGR